MGEVEWVTYIGPAFADKRGAIYNILQGVDIRQSALITTARGKHRGDHYHKKQTQYTFIVKGRVLCISCPADQVWMGKYPFGRNPNLVLTRQTATSGDLIVTPPGVVHKRVYLKATIEVALYTLARSEDEQEDAYKMELDDE